MTSWIRGLFREPWFFWLLTGFVANQASVNLLRPVVSYKALALGVDAATLGALSAVYALAPLLIMLQVGRLVDQKGEMRFILGGSLVMAIAGFGMAIAGFGMTITDAPAVLYLWYAILGLGQITAVVAVQAMVARGDDERRYDARFAAFSFSASIGQGIGPAIGGILVGSGSIGEISFALAAGAGIALLVLPMAVLFRPPATARRTTAADRDGATAHPSLLQMLRMPGILRAMLVSATVLSSIDILIIYLPALGEERHYPASLIGALLAIRAVSTTATRLFLARLTERYGRGPLLKGSMAIAAVALLALPIVDVVPLLVLIMVAAGTGLGIGQPLTMAWMAAAAAPGTRAMALAVRLMGNRVGQVALPVAAGALAAFGGAGGVLGVTGLIIGLSLAAVYGGLSGAAGGRSKASDQVA